MDVQVLIPMSWLRKTADLVEVVVSDPGATKSGVCPACASRNGRPVSEVGSPPYHNHCACGTSTVQRSTQPSEVLDEQFVGMQPVDDFEEPDEGGVEVFTL